MSFWQLEQGADAIAGPEEADALRKQQEAEFQRRLRGEYEEAQARVGSVVRAHDFSA